MFAAGLRPLLPLLALAAMAACSVVNKDHCANLEGDATCRERDPAFGFCSLCAADNNGCFAEAPVDACHAVTVPSAESTDGTAALTGSSTGDTTAVTVAIDPPTTSGSDSTSLPPDSSSSTGDTTSSTTAIDLTTTTTDDSSTSSGDTTEDTSTGSTGDTDTTAGTTMMGPVCGDGMIEQPEVCDGKNLGGESCKLLLPAKWGGGTLTCNAGCKSFNDTQCCVGVGQTCGGLLAPDAKLPCCPDLDCKPEGGKHVCKAA